MPQKLTALVEFFASHIPGNAWSLMGVSAVFLGFWAVGRLLTGRTSSESALAGWAFIYLLSVAAAVLGLMDVRWIAGAFLALVIGALVVAGKSLRPTRNSVVVALLLLPVAGVGLLMPLLHWDSYWHWVLNGSYLYWLDRFPTTPLEGFPSFHPTYPMATSLVYYFSSLITGRFLEGAGMFMNLALTVVALDCVVRLLRDLATKEWSVPETGGLYRYGLPVVALCIVLSLNPSFRAVNYFSAIADPALGIIVLLLIVRWCLFIAERSPIAGNREAMRDLLLLFMLGVLIGGVKHSGWALTFILSASGCFVGLVKRLPWARWLSSAVAVFAGTVLAQVLWSSYLSTHLAIPDQFSIQPIDQWRFDLLPALVAGIEADLAIEPFYYGLMTLTVIAGVIALFRRSFVKDERLSLMLSFVGVAMPVHFASLIAAYLGTGFNEMEISRAASLHRYSSHIGFAVCVFGMVALAWLAPRLAANAKASIAGKRAIVAGLALYALPLGFNILLPSVFAGSYYMKTYKALDDSAAKMAKVIPPTESVAIFGPEWAINFGSYHTWRPSSDTRGPVFKDRKIVQTPADLPSANEYLKRWQADPSIDHIWMFDAEVLTTAFGKPHARHLVWSRSTGRWDVIDENGPTLAQQLRAAPAQTLSATNPD